MRHPTVLIALTMILLLTMTALFAQTPPRILVQKLVLEDGDIMNLVTNTGNTHAPDYILRALHVETGAEIGTDIGGTPVENLRINQVDAGFVAAIVNQSAFPAVWPAGNTLRLTITYIPTNEVAVKNITIPAGTSAIILTDPADIMIVPPYEGSINPNPNIASNPIPANNTTDVSINLNSVGWSYISNPNYTDPVGFRVYLNNTGNFNIDDPFEWIYYVTGQQDYQNSNVLPDELQYDITYYWKVVPTTIDPTVIMLTGQEDAANYTLNSIRNDNTRNDATNVPIWSFTTEEAPPFAGGSGTADDPYLIATAEQLNFVRDFLSYHFRQIANIHLGVAPWNVGAGWQPIGTTNNSFTGVYDGDSHTISNLTINRPTIQYQGLFGETDQALIENIILNNVNIVGQNRTGGVVGQNKASTINNCVVYGTISGAWFVGGITGYNLNNGIITNCQSSALVSGTQSVGGLVGYQISSSAQNSWSTGNITNTGIYTGGLVGYNSNNSSISQCYATGNVSGGANAGGLVGYNTSNSTVTQCNSSGSVNSSANYSGGIIGYNGNGIVSNSYSTGNVTGNAYIGGLIGYNSTSTVNHCYSIGSVTGSSNLGGLVGAQYNSTVISSYWNTQTSGQTNSAGGQGSNTANMQQMATYIGWDFATIWAIFENETYPILQWLLGDYLFPVTDLTAVFDDGQVYLNWSAPYLPTSETNFSLIDNTTNTRLELLGYNVYRNQTMINPALVIDTEYYDPNVQYGVTYNYYVTVVYVEGESGQSNVASVTPEPPYLYPPVNLTAQAGHYVVHLSWEEPILPDLYMDHSNRSRYVNNYAMERIDRLEFLGFNLYRNGTMINTNLLTNTEFVDDDVINGITYTYYVTAVYQEGESEPSNAVEVTPQEPTVYPPLNLSFELDDYNVILNWDEPIIGDAVELVYDNDEATGAYSYNGYTMATQMSPDQPGQILALKYYTTTSTGSNVFNAEIYNWANNQPGTNLLFTENVIASNNQWTLVNIAQHNLYFDSDFVVGFGSINTTTLLGYDSNLDNGRSWDFNSTNNTWSSWNEAYLIRAIVVYQDGTIAQLSPISTERKQQDSGIAGSKISMPVESTIDNLRGRNRELTLVGYNVYRDDVQINSETVTDNYYVDPDLTPDNVYFYYVTALYSDDNFYGESGPSNTVEVQIVGLDGFVTEIPLLTRLHNNYPNPFNPNTTIQFTIAEANEVKIDVFNSRGQKVITLVDDHLDRGEYKVSWNGRDFNNRPVSSGIYFYHMMSGSYQTTRKMILMK